MACARRLLKSLTLLVLLGMLAACRDAQSPQPPPRVPQPKMERDAIDPVRPRPAAGAQAREV